MMSKQEIVPIVYWSFKVATHIRDKLSNLYTAINWDRTEMTHAVLNWQVEIDCPR